MKRMKHILSGVLCFALLAGIVSLGQPAKAYTPPLVTNSGIQYPISLATGKDAKGKVVFPDNEFWKYIKQETFQTGLYTGISFDINEDGVLSKEECETVRVLSITNQKEVKSVKGIEAFPKLRELSISGTGVSELDLSNNPRLQILKTSGNAITTLDVSPCPLLKELQVRDCQLTSLDLGANTALNFFVCGEQQRKSYQYKEENQYRVMLGDLDANLELSKVSNVKIDGAAGDGVHSGYHAESGMVYCSNEMQEISYTYDINFAGTESESTELTMDITINLGVAVREAYETNGGSRVLAQYFSTGEKDHAPQVPKKDGYTFTKWYKTAACVAGDEWTFGTALTDNLTLYAGWAKKYYTVHYKPNGGDMASKTKKEKVDWWSTALLPDKEENPVKKGYQLSGWKTQTGKTLSTTNNKMTYGEASGNSDKSETTLTALWTPKSGYNVRYVAAVSNKNQKKVKNFPANKEKGNLVWTTTELLPTQKPKRKGYQFIGWYTAKQGGIKVTKQTTYATVFESQFQGDSTTNIPTLYARFQKKRYTIRYWERGGSKVKNRKKVVWGSKNLLPKKKTKRKNYVFKGWVCNGKKVTKKTRMNFITNGSKKVITLKARWKKKR